MIPHAFSIFRFSSLLRRSAQFFLSLAIASCVQSPIMDDRVLQTRQTSFTMTRSAPRLAVVRDCTRGGTMLTAMWITDCDRVTTSNTVESHEQGWLLGVGAEVLAGAADPGDPFRQSVEDAQRLTPGAQNGTAPAERHSLSSERASGVVREICIQGAASGVSLTPVAGDGAAVLTFDGNGRATAPSSTMPIRYTAESGQEIEISGCSASGS